MDTQTVIYTLASPRQRHLAHHIRAWRRLIALIASLLCFMLPCSAFALRDPGDQGTRTSSGRQMSEAKRRMA